MVKFLPLMFGFLLAGLFIISIINGGILLGYNNNAPQNIADDPSINAYAIALNNTLDNAYTDAVAVDSAVNQSAITLTTGFPVFDAIFGIWKIIKVVPITIYNLTFGLLFEKVFGNEAYGIVFGVISAILIISVIYAVYRVLTTGEAE